MANTEPGSESRPDHKNGWRRQTTVEDNRLVDHHIEELLGAFREAMPARESGDEDPSPQRLD